MTPTVTKQEYQAVLFNYNQLEKEWYQQRELITELADALDFVMKTGKYPMENLELLDRAREALKS